MNKIFLFTIALGMVFICGCSLPFQLAADLAGKLAASAIESNKTPTSNVPTIGKDLGRYKVGNHEITVKEYYRNNGTRIIFTAFKGGELVDAATFVKEIDIKVLNDYNQADEMGKKKMIKEWFMNRGIDLGPL